MRYIYLFAFLIFWTVIEKIIINKFNIKKKEWRYKHVNEIHKWLEVLLIIGILLMFFVDAYYSLVGLTVLLGFSAFMEWKFEKESKTYILNILNGSVCILFLIILKPFL
ncbi:DUF4181 domain-containing protein [Alkaliphilus sp. MSJ-5]|uniref:DUF4181 domain-containing protein n=1 Tax=Alkaliphilus flagellatus TaxID=2841507 RepID=A0ABS6G5B5_9FIRM|nr:DUF4181 domain-containing protein [Alkaliphilus flagellatus]MBU5677679.1 DUF4181 domain-containing protein [Alkaliphilus flagellatus]